MAQGYIIQIILMMEIAVQKLAPNSTTVSLVWRTQMITLQGNEGTQCTTYGSKFTRKQLNQIKSLPSGEIQESPRATPWKLQLMFPAFIACNILHKISSNNTCHLEVLSFFQDD